MSAEAGIAVLRWVEILRQSDAVVGHGDGDCTFGVLRAPTAIFPSTPVGCACVMAFVTASPTMSATSAAMSHGTT